MKTFKTMLGAVGVMIISSTCAYAAPIYQYVGSWYVDDGPYWAQQDQNGNYTTPVLSGVEAAAFIFGGNLDDYAISTVSSDLNDINFKAWMDGWADSVTYGTVNPAPQDLHIDVDGDGLYAVQAGYGNAYSAYVSDHGVHLRNFAFRIIGDDAVPVAEPASLALLGAGLLSLGFLRRRKT